ncbi:MAG: chemotaxis protein CheW [Acidobacteriia bacterium]|nr:chemotaxis protein CheW [Terriglobia bacterium]
MAMRQFCTFRVGGELFGIGVERVQEVINYQQMTPIPFSSALRGLINLRGQIIVAIDLRTRLQMEERPADQAPMNVVLRSEEGAVSLLVDEICDVVNVTEQTFEAVPVTMRAAFKEIISGVHKLDKDLMLVLDAQRAIDVGVEMSEVNSVEHAVSHGVSN